LGGKCKRPLGDHEASPLRMQFCGRRGGKQKKTGSCEISGKDANRIEAQSTIKVPGKAQLAFPQKTMWLGETVP